jgi:protein ImuB
MRIDPNEASGRDKDPPSADQARRISVWCPDWPVTTARIEAGLPPDAPIAVVTANRVIACSQQARANGVRRGLRRREAQSLCPGLYVLARDESAEARTF